LTRALPGTGTCSGSNELASSSRRTGARRKAFLRHHGLETRLGLTQHRGGGQEPFDETHVGIDPWPSRSPTGRNWMPGPSDWPQPRSSIPRWRRPTRSPAPPSSFSATRTGFSSSCSSIYPAGRPTAASRSRSLDGVGADRGSGITSAADVVCGHREMSMAGAATSSATTCS